MFRFDIFTSIETTRKNSWNILVSKMYNKKCIIPTVRELYRSVRTIQVDWNLKTPLQKWCYLFGIGRAPFILPVVPVFESV